MVPRTRASERQDEPEQSHPPSGISCGRSNTTAPVNDDGQRRILNANPILAARLPSGAFQRR